MAKETYAERQVALLDKARKALNSGTKLDALPKDQKDALRREYGYAYAFITSNPELRKLFTRAVREGFTAQAFSLELQNTNWYKNSTASQREYDTMLNTPSMKKDLENTLATIADRVKREAVAANNVQLSDEEAMETARRIARNNLRDWESVLPNIIRSEYVSDDIFKFGGEAATALTQIQNYARQMGVSLSDQALGSYVDRVFSGEETVDNIQENIRQSAVSYFPQFADRIKAGETVDSIVKPYKDMIGSYLEIDSENIDYVSGNGKQADALLQKALFASNDKPMSLFDLQRMIKQDERWQKTSNARQEYSTLTTNLLRKFGVGL